MKSSLQLLICEDAESDASMIIRQLEKTGYTVSYQRVETANDMKDALQKQAWDIVICDYNIPGFGGLQALAILQATGKDTPFILISGTIGEETAVNIMKAGASDYLMKHNLVRLSEVVKREMEEAENRKKGRAAAEQIRANEEKYRAVINHSLYAIFLSRPGELIQESNRAASKLFGYTAAEFLQLGREDLLDFTDPVLLQKLAERDAKGSGKGEATGIRKNGERFYCEVSSVIFKDIDGNDMSCTMLNDITARKKAEQQLRERSQELKKLSHHLKNAREDERKHIAREIHDELGQLASAIKIELDWLNQHLTTLEEKIKSRVDRAIDIVKTMIDSTRKIAMTLRPTVIDELRLNASLKWQCEEFTKLNAIPCLFEEDFDDKDISIEMRTELFRICQESLTNVMRHARATRVSVSIQDRNGALNLLITDNGNGFDTNTKSAHLGLVGLRERAYSINGELIVTSNPGKGTTIHLVVPGKLMSS